MIYKITGYNVEEIQGSFYEQELQKTKQDIFMIVQIIKQQGNKSLVKWLGIMIRLTRGLIIKTLSNYRAKVRNVRYFALPGFHKFSRGPFLLTFFTGSPPVVGLTIFASTI